MQISTKGRYALRLMLDLAVHNTGELVKIKDISARENISEKYLEQIISSLKKAGYVKSLQCNLIQYSLNSFIKHLPETECDAFPGSAALIRFVLQTGYRLHAAFCQSQNSSHRICFRLSGKHITALCPSQALYISRLL